jgi:hypothetical protein
MKPPRLITAEDAKVAEKRSISASKLRLPSTSMRADAFNRIL